MPTTHVILSGGQQIYLLPQSKDLYSEIFSRKDPSATQRFRTAAQDGSVWIEPCDKPMTACDDATETIGV